MKHDAYKNAYLSKLSLFLSNATSTVNPSETKSCRDFDQNEGRDIIQCRYLRYLRRFGDGGTFQTRQSRYIGGHRFEPAARFQPQFDAAGLLLGTALLLITVL